MTPYVNDADTVLRAAGGDESAMAQVVETNLGLVKSIALRFTGRGVELEDLIQIGTVGMIRAIRGFRPEKECRFTTYAVPYIMGEIRRFLRDDGWIKVSRDIRADAARIARYADRFEKEQGKSPTMDEICRALSLTEEKAALAMASARPALSLNAENEETGFSPEKILGEDPIEKVTGVIALHEAIASLPPEEKRLILLRYFKGLTQEQTARILSFSQVKVSREEKRILAKMRKEFTAAS